VIESARFTSCVAPIRRTVTWAGSWATCIEPYPDSGSCPPGGLAAGGLIGKPAGSAAGGVPPAEPGDFLFIDSTHVVKVGGDVTYLYFEVLPRLGPGVHVHIHDVFFPFEYPRGWIEEGRVWSEAYLLRAFLLHNREFEITLFNTFLQGRHPELFERHFPLALKNPGGSIWLRRR
jgi:hypothetical protein